MSVFGEQEEAEKEQCGEAEGKSEECSILETKEKIFEEGLLKCQGGREVRGN